MKKESFEEFMDIFFSNELILVLLVVLVIILVILIVYLIKLEMKDKKVNKDKLLNTEPIIIIEDSVEKEKNQNDDPLGIFNVVMPTNDEDNAIISTDELVQASKELSDTLQLDTSEIIDMYEEEQEKKAIISYDELLKNAASLNIKYEEPKEKELDAPLVKKIEIEEDNAIKSNIESSNKILDYVEEEEFLKTLKKFRMDLKT